MPQKTCQSFCFSFWIWVVSYTALTFASGGMMRLGGYALQKTGYQGYDAYNTAYGFEAAAYSALIWQWLTAALVTLYVMLPTSGRPEPIQNKIPTQIGMLLLTSAAFACFHLMGLPIVEKVMLKCISLKTEVKDKNPLCTAENQNHLFVPFFTGCGLSMVGVLGLYAVYIIFCCAHEACAKENSAADRAPDVIMGGGVFRVEMREITQQITPITNPLAGPVQNRVENTFEHHAPDISLALFS